MVGSDSIVVFERSAGGEGDVFYDRITMAAEVIFINVPFGRTIRVPVVQRGIAAVRRSGHWLLASAPLSLAVRLPRVELAPAAEYWC